MTYVILLVGSAEFYRFLTTISCIVSVSLPDMGFAAWFLVQSVVCKALVIHKWCLIVNLETFPRRYARHTHTTIHIHCNKVF